MKGKPGRHVPAFVLLQLAKSPNYGLQILNDLKETLPVCHLDSAAVYRALNSLESSGCVLSYDEPEPQNGVVKKYYKITPAGHDELKKMHDDILMRLANLKYFIKTYEEMEEGL